MNNLVKLYKKNKEVISYLFWGVLTTVVDLLVAFLLNQYTYIDSFWNTAIAWLASVIFAFFTNRKWVFHSSANNIKQFFTEMGSFTFGRFASLVLEEIIIWVGQTLMHGSFNVVKILAQIIVILFNYFWSKFVVFINHNK
ncbi:GtrA family protein [Apilactobacillus timberlakei]|uniref:GtrA family protein n=1 Tax=Apilactobacillus timberlakei TaxID=2008380 RepID=UPI00112D536F|nr:GtrA family protein [Apilactobacillus timberlakei]TPR14579.1 GtrA family protein [Apilactobacillus timberlakei]TPR17312.1 GtrA family protein [Apilactobacillus timberlakei]TPR18407.1 GtrA family protein [Apilactobacillus timberlakei]TPR18617.1 GtrA family protein [Apilactobacillus timberlakei]TPR20698.1 GtrA family protein [Apilactobacillus timberlakei]